MDKQKTDLEAIFSEALDRGSEEDLDAYLTAACGEDVALRTHVEALLRSHREAGNFLGKASAYLPTRDMPPISESLGDIIGPYKLLQQIGEGGMGVVYMAEQTQPVERRVALKIIKPGMDTQQVIARFEAERQALAMMDHPNIAKVLDAGTTATGRPFFVMELVKGLPITQYCDEQHLSPRERLELFLPICQAVQHAHQKGIIHRDLKPSNILIARYDDKPVPKVIDFGVAKATSQKLTEKTMFTQYGQLVGTIDYMSPEQAQFNQLDVDTRSDIYSLGVLLYELLTGETPFDQKRLRTAAYEEMLRIIREEEPPCPSVKLSGCETLASVAANRHMEPHKLGILVRGELDWIVMKALEKDRTRRYETANGFAMDVQRYLTDEPVLACPPSAGYRIRKFVQRNKAAVLAASIVALALVGGIMGTTWGLVRAESAGRAEAEQTEKAQTKEREALAAAEQERQAKQREAEQRGIAETRRDEAEAQRQRAEQNLLKAREAVDQMLTAVAENKLAQTPQMEPLRRELLEKAAQFYEDFLKDESKDPRVRFGTAKAHQKLAFLYRRLGHIPQSLQAYQRAIKVLEELTAEQPSEPMYRSALALALAQSAGSLVNLENFTEAETTYRRAIEIHDALLLQFPEEMTYLQLGLEAQLELAGMLSHLRRFKEAEVAFRQSLAVLEKLPADLLTTRRSLYWTYAGLATAFAQTQRLSEAEQYYGKALDLALVVQAESTSDPELRMGVVRIEYLLALLFRDTNRLQDAERLLRENTARAGAVVADFPHTAHYRAILVASNLDLYRILVNSKRLDEANKFLRESLTNAEKLVADAPEPPWHQKLLREHYFELAAFLSVQGQETEAQRFYLRYVEVSRNDPTAYNDAAWALVTRPDLKSHKPAQAVAFAKRAVELAPSSASFVNTLGTAYYRHGEWQACIDTLKKAEALRPGSFFSHNAFFIAMAHWQLSDKEAGRWYDQAVEWMDKNKPNNEELLRFRAEAAELLELKKTN